MQPCQGFVLLVQANFYCGKQQTLVILTPNSSSRTHTTKGRSRMSVTMVPHWPHSAGQPAAGLIASALDSQRPPHRSLPGAAVSFSTNHQRAGALSSFLLNWHEIGWNRELVYGTLQSCGDPQYIQNLEWLYDFWDDFYLFLWLFLLIHQQVACLSLTLSLQGAKFLEKALRLPFGLPSFFLSQLC